MANKVGRPTKYNPELINKVDEYLSTVGKEQMTLPTKFGFSRFIDVNTDTLVEWEKSYPQFSAAIKKIEEYQRQQLMDDGMYGGKEVNQAMAIFLLKANHGLIETQRTEISGPGGEPVGILAYSDYDSAQLRSEKSKRSSPTGIATSSEIPSPQLAQESQKNDSSDK